MLGIKLGGDGLYEEFQRIYDESVDRDTDKEKAEYKMWNSGRGRWFLCSNFPMGNNMCDFENSKFVIA